jgi:glycosyltransferase involved in cell wall biosynthesis
MKLSVIICTYNPKPHYLNRVLLALREQSLQNTEWELLLVDNGSKEPLSKSFDMSWHPRGRHILEVAPGVTAARARGLSEATGDLLVFVDDDTVLSREYLEIAGAISCRFPMIGIWGGQIHPEFEKNPEPWMQPFLELLTIHCFDKDRWSNIPGAVCPPAAGMCLRREVAVSLLQLFESSPLRKSLIGAKRSHLERCEDMDMDMSACDLGYGTGQFTGLKLTHLIGKERVSLDYLVKVHEGGCYSMRILMALRGEWKLKPKCKSLIQRWRQWRYEGGLEPRVRRIVQAGRTGEEKAEAYIRQHLQAIRPCP